MIPSRFRRLVSVITGAGNPYYSLFCSAEFPVPQNKFPVPELTGNLAEGIEMAYELEKKSEPETTNALII
jgi:hypothetical protein